MPSNHSVLFVTPTPPPWHGGAVAAQIVLESPKLNEKHELLHLDAKFVDSVAELQGLSIKKLLRLLRYLIQLFTFRFGKNVGAVVLTPTFYFGSFLKDSLFIWLAFFLRYKRRAAWFHMSFVTLKYDERNRLERWYVRQTLLRCTDFIVQSKSLLDSFPAFVNRESCHLIPNGVDDPGGVIEQPSETTEILYVSNMDEAKGWRVLFAAAERLLSECPQKNIRVRFFGGETKAWPLREIEEVFAAGKFPDQIIYGGFVTMEEKEQALRKADVFCLPSFNEAFPLTVLEAMSYGVAVVASDVGAVKDAVKDGQGGFLVTPNSVDSLYAGLLKVVESEELRSEMGQLNRKNFLSGFTKEAYCDRWSQTLASLTC